VWELPRFKYNNCWLGFKWTRKRNCPRPLQYISISGCGKAGLVSTDKIGRASRRPSTGVPHHCCELQERIATQFDNSQLKIIEPALDLSLRFLRIEQNSKCDPFLLKCPCESQIAERTFNNMTSSNWLVRLYVIHFRMPLRSEVRIMPTNNKCRIQRNNTRFR
jgi:hypothetical protein